MSVYDSVFFLEFKIHDCLIGITLYTASWRNSSDLYILLQSEHFQQSPHHASIKKRLHQAFLRATNYS
jgi:hypothetical protein